MKPRVRGAIRTFAMAVAVAVLLNPGAQCVSAWAEEQTPAVSLDQLLEELRRANPDLLAARKRLESAQAKVPLSKGLPAPKIGVEFEEIPRGTIKVNRATAMYQFLQMIPFPGKLSLKAEVALKEAQVVGMMLKQKELELTTELKSAYYNLFLADQESELEQEKQVWLKQAAAVAEVRYSMGKGMQQEVFRLQGELLESNNQIEVLGYRRQALEAHLNHMVNRHPPFAALGRTTPLTLVPVPSSPDQLLAAALENQPELLVFKFAAEKAESAWKLSKRELFPDLETMVQLRDPPMAPIGPWDLSLALVLPFWFWTKQKYGVQVALRDKESAAAAYQAMRNEIGRRIHERWYEASGAYATAHLCEEGLLPLAEKSVSSALAGYQAGRGSFMELLDALRNWSEKKKVYFQHLVQLQQELAMLEQAVGVSLAPSQPIVSSGGRS